MADLIIQKSQFEGSPWVRRVPDRPDIFANEWGQVSDELIWRESWDIGVYQVNPQWFTGGTVIDLGANVGAFTLIPLLLNPYERVVAVEPESTNRGILCDNLQVNGWIDRVDVLDCAVGQQRGTCHMINAGGTATTVAGGDITVITLDDVAAGCAGVIDLLKFDIEGAEWDVFSAASDHTMTRFRYMVGEWHPTDHFRLGAFLAKLTKTHSFSIIGKPHTGGQIWAHLHEL